MAPAQMKTYTEEDYYSLPEDIRSELIDGQFYAMSAPSRIHQEILSELHITIGQYLREKKGSCRVYPAPFAVRLFADRKTVVAPDWIIEIVSPGNPGHDYVRKLNLYLDAGVREYWIVDPASGQIYVYDLEETSFCVKTYTFQDQIKAGIYDDLYLDFSAFEFSV